MKFLKGIGFVITKFNHIVAKAASYLIFPIIGIIIFEVFCRYVLNSPTPYTYDLIWMMYGALIFLGGAYALDQDVHVKADILYNMMKWWGKTLINAICYPLFFFSSVIAFVYASYGLMVNAWIYKEISRFTLWGPPTAPIKTVMFIAFAMLLLQGIVKFIQLMKPPAKVVKGGDAS